MEGPRILTHMKKYNRNTRKRDRMKNKTFRVLTWASERAWELHTWHA